MFNPDLSMGLAKAWTDAALGYMTASTSAALDMANQTLSFWSQSPENVVLPASSATTKPAVSAARSRSWYRAPSQSPFDFGSAGPAGNLPIPFTSGWPVMGPSISLFSWPGAPTLPCLLQSWATMAAAAGMLFSPPRLALDWRTFGLPWFWNSLPLPGSSPAREQPTPFSVYRSDGGHAVAQVTFPNQVIAAVAFPPAAAMLAAALFRWPQ
jgi:hypothetical protein